MIKNLAPREKIIMWVSVFVITAYIFMVFIGKPLYQKLKNTDQTIQSRVLFINKYKAILSQKDYYQQKVVAVRRLKKELKQRFLDSPKPALAVAGLQKIIENGIVKNSVDIIRFKIEKTRFTEGLLTVPVEVTVRSTLRNLAQFIRHIENHQKFLVIENLRTRRINKRDPEILESRLLVSGFVQQLLVPPSNKT